jgi:hypothetical protein
VTVGRFETDGIPFGFNVKTGVNISNKTIKFIVVSLNSK